MPLVKMKYGIDLGTTNSSLCKCENGELKIVQSDTLKDTVPSCVSFTKNKVVRVGDSAYNDLRADKSNATKKWAANEENVFLEFKRTMGLNKRYKSSNMNKAYYSEELSAEVLKTLFSFVKEEKPTACVITIPAKFKTDQISATMRAARMAGIEHCELLQEPIAASIAYGLSAKEKDGTWLVFDFGGGTFDVALLNVQDGILQVKDTEGDNYLGGKNIDYAIVDQILIPYLEKNNSMKSIITKAATSKILRDGLKFYAEQAKNQLSSSDSCDITSQLDEFGKDEQGEDIELDLTITRDQLKTVAEPFYQRAIDICNNLLERNNVSKDKVTSLILVGGPTYSPILRDMLREQVTPNVDTSIDPMTAVALGSALYASTIDYEENIALPETEQVVALDVNYESNSVSDFEYVSFKTLPDESVGEIPDKLFVEVVRSDNSWSSGRVALEPSGIVVECFLQEGKPNSFSINLYDEAGNSFRCFPHDISILQGTKIASAVLPYYIGIEVKDVTLDRDVFASLKGLEKNVTLPATGTIMNLAVPKEIRPDHALDKLVVPIYQGEYDANGTSAIYNDPVFEVEITGEDVNSLVIANSDVDITIKIDKSQMMTLEAYFHCNDETVEKSIDVAKRKVITLKQLTEFLNEGRKRVKYIRDTYNITGEEVDEIEKGLLDVKKRYASEKNFEDGRMHLLADMRRAFRTMERIEKDHEWETLEPLLDEVYNAIVHSNEEFLEHRYDDTVSEVKKKYDELKNLKDGGEARRVIKDFKHTLFRMTSVYQIADFIMYHHVNFDPAEWSNPQKAKASLAKGAKMIVGREVSLSELQEIVSEIVPLYILSKGSKAIKF